MCIAAFMLLDTPQTNTQNVFSNSVVCDDGDRTYNCQKYPRRIRCDVCTQMRLQELKQGKSRFDTVAKWENIFFLSWEQKKKNKTMFCWFFFISKIIFFFLIILLPKT